MPWLSSAEVVDYWRTNHPELAGLLETIERVEDWTLDSLPDIAERLERFGEKLLQPGVAQRLDHADRNDLLFLLVYLSSSKAMRVIEWLNEHREQQGTRLIESLLSQDAAGIYTNVLDPLLAQTLVSRLNVVRNTPFFQEILSSRRLEAVLDAVQTHQERNQDA